MGRLGKIVGLHLEQEVLSLSARGLGTYQVANILSTQYNTNIDKANVRSFLTAYKRNATKARYKETACQDEFTANAAEARKTLVKANSILWGIVEQAEAEGRLNTALRAINAILRNIRINSSFTPVELPPVRANNIQTAIDLKAALQRLHTNGTITINDSSLLA